MKVMDGAARLARAGASLWWRARDAAGRDRATLWGGATGLRMAAFHDLGPPELETLGRLVEWARRDLALATPEDVDDLLEGRFRAGPVDRLLFTFDDGLTCHLAAGRLLATLGVRATFFVVPSLVGRTVEDYLRRHAARGVAAGVPSRVPGGRGLARGEVAELLALGHRVAAHNFAHRDLGRLSDPEALRYEIDEAVDAVATLTGAPCRDFAVAYGQPEHLSEAASAHLLASGLRVYACHRGLNAPGRTPRFLLRHAVEPDHPFAFTTACLSGAADRRMVGRVRHLEARVGRLPLSGPPRP